MRALAATLKNYRKAVDTLNLPPAWVGAPPTTLVPPAVVEAARSVVPPKPVETWSVVARSKNTADTPNEVVKKVVEQVESTLGVRVYGNEAIRGGGGVFRTPSVAEREKIVANAKLGKPS